MYSSRKGKSVALLLRMEHQISKKVQSVNVSMCRITISVSIPYLFHITRLDYYFGTVLSVDRVTASRLSKASSLFPSRPSTVLKTSNIATLTSAHIVNYAYHIVALIVHAFPG